MKVIKIVFDVISILIILTVGAVYLFAQFYVKVPPLKVSESIDRNAQVEIIDAWLINLQGNLKFNGVVLMMVNGETVLEKGYGYTNHTLKDKLTPQSSMRLASVSKQFTAAGIMLLHDQGKLDFDHDVSMYIEGFPYPGVTIRHLLNQTSGVPDNYMTLGEANVKSGDFLNLETAVKLIIEASAPAYAAPKVKYQYSNTNYILLAYIAEIVSNQSFEAFMKSALFKPLGMENTRVWNAFSQDTSFPNKTEGFDVYKSDGSKAVELTLLDGVAGDGAIFSSIEDFKIWTTFWSENALVSPETLAQAFVAPRLTNEKVSDYGFGWVLTPNAHWHNGKWLATNAFVARNPTQDSTLVVIDNSHRLSFDGVVRELSAAMRAMKH